MKNIVFKFSLLFISILTLTIAACEDEVDEMVVTQPPLDVAIRFGGEVLEIPDSKNFFVDPEQTTFTVPLGVELSTVTLDSFKVEVAANQTAVDQLISNGTLENTIVIPADMFSLPSVVKVQGNTISAPLHLMIDFDVLTENPGKKVAIAVDIQNSDRHSVNAEKQTAVIVIDTDAAIAASEIGDVTDKYLQNTGYPFISTERATAGGRWGNLDGWEENEAAKSHSGYGGFNSDAGGTFGLEAGWGSPNIPNGKVWQTTTLPAGKYSFEVAQWEWNGINTDPAYFVVAEGNTIPDYDALGGAISYSSLSSGVVEFTLEEETEVSLGVVVNFVDGSGQGFKIKELSLIKIE